MSLCARKVCSASGSFKVRWADLLQVRFTRRFPLREKAHADTCSYSGIESGCLFLPAMSSIFRSALLLFCALFFGCVADKPSGPRRSDSYPIPSDAALVQVQGEAGGQLRIPLAGEPRTFNYLAAADARSKLLAYLINTSLLEYDAAEQTVREGICKSYEVSDDGLKVRLLLREGLFFSDGKPFSADDVVFTFQKLYEAGSRKRAQGDSADRGESSPSPQAR